MPHNAQAPRQNLGRVREGEVNRDPLFRKVVKNLPAMRETWVQYLGWEDPLEKGKAIHSSILAWRIPWAV